MAVLDPARPLTSEQRAILEEMLRRGLKPGASKPKWRSIARAEQLRPDDCDVLILTGGRGSGKTRPGAEDFLERVRDGVKRLHILAPTIADARDVCVEGVSGILACARPGEVSTWNRSMGELKFSNGAQAKCFSAEEPDRLNGPQAQHIWGDEFGIYGNVNAIDMALFGLRLGNRITSCWTGTPKPTKSTKYILALQGATIRRMRMRDNIKNLAPDVVERLETKYAGTRIGRQELDGEIIEDVEGALWNRAMLGDADENGNVLYPGFRVPCIAHPNVSQMYEALGIVRVVVSVDPTTADPELKKNPYKEMDECGIIVAGCDSKGIGYTIADLSGTYSPSKWAKIAATSAHVFKAAFIVAEANQGGEMVKEVIQSHSPGCKVEMVHAHIGKRSRAESWSGLYEQGRWRHCSLADMGGGKFKETGGFAKLEDEQCTWVASDPSQPSPNRIDAGTQAAYGLGLCSWTETRVSGGMAARR